MSTQPLLDPSRSVVLIMDYQNGRINPNAHDPAGLVQIAERALAGARGAGIPVIYVQHHGGAMVPGSAEFEIYDGVKPAAGERVLVKTKPGAFSTTGLDVMLRTQGKDTLILLGVNTSGCVLSTARWGMDLNYKYIVLKDACDDQDTEVQKVLTEKVLSRQGTVVTVDDFLRAVAK